MHPDLETSRLIIRGPDPEFALQLLRLHQNNQQHFLIGVPRQVIEQDSTSFWHNKLASESLMQHRKAQYNFYGFLKHSNELVCHVQASNVMRGIFQAAHIGYKIDQQHEGQGLMFEAMSEVIRFLFQDLNLHRLMANYQPQNLRSENLARRLGFVQEGLARNYLYLDGEWRDHVLTSLTNPDFDDSQL